MPLLNLRHAATGLENHLVDEFLAGRLDRRALLRHGSRIGMSGALLGALLGWPRPARAASPPGVAGATMRVACDMPAGAVDPVTVSQPGGLLMLAQTGEFLCAAAPDLSLRPMLALSWQPNEDASVWRFRLRPGVHFHDGAALTAADVVATMDRLANPRNASNALSALRGVLSPGAAQAEDGLTVRFELDKPNGNFPYYVSSDNYNAIILPASYAGGYEKSFPGTGPFRLESFTPKVGASFVRNDAYWGPPALPARSEFSFYTDQQSQLLALQDGQVDIIAQVAVQGAQGLIRSQDFRMLRLRSAAHRQVHMRTDDPRFADTRVRRAIALSLDRAGIVHGLFDGLAEVGNDSPFAPIYPSTNKAVPQRHRDLAQARALMQQAGKAGGFAATLVTERLQEMPDFAVVIQNACADIGIDLTLRIEDPALYYGAAQPGSSDWLDSPMGMTDYGHRAVPNVTLAAPLLSNGAWNAAHFRNPRYDSLVATYIAALDPAAQRQAAGEIETLLLDETPVIFAYFFDYLVATSRRVQGVQATAIGQLFLQNATLTA